MVLFGRKAGKQKPSTKLGDEEYFSAESDNENERGGKPLNKNLTELEPSPLILRSNAAGASPLDLAVLEVLERMTLFLDNLAKR